MSSGKRPVLDSTPSTRPSKRPRKNEVILSDLPTISDISEPVQILRGSWRFLNFFEFCRIYRSLFALPRFSLDDLERDLLPVDTDDTNSVRPDRTKTLVDLIIRLLSNIKVKGVSSITSDNWQTVLKRISSVYYGPDLFPDSPSSSFESLPLASQIHLLHFISELVFEENLDKVINAEMEPDQQRVFPIGEDSNGRTYWLFGENRMYIERPGKKKSNEYSFALIASTLESWETCLDPLNRSRSRTDKQLLEILKPIAEAIRAKLSAKEKEAARQAYLDSLPKKRSERIVAKQAQEEEKAKLDKLMKEQAIADAARKAEESRLRDEERRRKLEEEAEEDRRRMAEQKAFQVEQAHLRAEERKRMKELMQASEKALLADLAESLQNRNLPEEPIKSPQPVEAMAKLLMQGKDKPKLVRFSMDLAAHNSISLTGRPGRLSVPTLAEFWVGSDENGKEMTSVLKLWCRDLLDSLIAMEDAWPFVEPVDTVALDIPQYLSIITDPMDFGTVRQKAVCSAYPNFREFWEDVRLVLNNCIKFNGVKSPYSILARKIEKVIADMVTSCGFVVQDEDFVPVGFNVPEKEPTPPPSPSPLSSSEPPEGAPRSLRPRRSAALRKSFKEDSDDDDIPVGSKSKMRTPTQKASDSVGPYGAVRLHERPLLLPRKGTELPRIHTDFQDQARHYQPLAIQQQGMYHFAPPSDHHRQLHYAAHYSSSPAPVHAYSSSQPVYQAWHPSTPVHGHPTQYPYSGFSSSDNHNHKHHHQQQQQQQQQNRHHSHPRIAPAPSPVHGSAVSPFALPSPNIARAVPWPVPPPPPRYVSQQPLQRNLPPTTTATTPTMAGAAYRQQPHGDYFPQMSNFNHSPAYGENVSVAFESVQRLGDPMRPEGRLMEKGGSEGGDVR